MTQRQIERIMSDAVDINIDKPEPEIDVKTDKPIDMTAMMHKQDNPKAESIHEEAKAPMPPMVDLDTDERVFAILDEGCNSTCHARTWGRKGTEAPRDVGQYFRIIPRAEAQLQGI